MKKKTTWKKKKREKGSAFFPSSPSLRLREQRDNFLSSEEESEGKNENITFCDAFHTAALTNAAVATSRRGNHGFRVETGREGIFRFNRCFRIQLMLPRLFLFLGKVDVACCCWKRGEIEEEKNVSFLKKDGKKNVPQILPYASYVSASSSKLKSCRLSVRVNRRREGKEEKKDSRKTACPKKKREV